MTGEFERDLQSAGGELEAARSALLGIVQAMRDADLERALGGGWKVRRVLGHLIETEWEYARMVARLRELPGVPGDVVSGSPSSMSDALRRLHDSRVALLAAVEGVGEESFYRLRAVDGVECSVLGLLEQAAHHDQQHTEQIRVILATS